MTVEMEYGFQAPEGSVTSSLMYVTRNVMLAEIIRESHPESPMFERPATAWVPIQSIRQPS